MVPKLNSSFDIALFLSILTITSGLIALGDLLFFSKKRGVNEKIPWPIDYARSFFPILLTVLIIRSFIIQPYRVPTGSLEPTILPGDFIIVNQYAYGLRLPVINKKFISIGSPKRGDIILFRYPVNPKIIFVKRVVGIPGDHIIYRDKNLFINGKQMEQIDLGNDIEAGNGLYKSVKVKLETLDKITHRIFLRPDRASIHDLDLIVPDNSFFVMGDNRDNSNDSREWGCVPENYLIGKAFGIWMSWDSPNKKIRWNRIGQKIY